MENVHKVCKAIAQLSDEDLSEAEDEARCQVNYSHPFRLAKQGRVNKAGKRNMKVIADLRSLKTLILQGKP